MPVDVSPPLEEAAALAADHTLVPLRHEFVADCETPVSAFLKLRGEGPAFLLESAEQGKRFGRYSFIGYRPREVLRWTLEDGGDPYAIAAAAVGRFSQAPLDGLPPFAGGAVGFFGYDLVRTVEPLGPPGPDPLGLPDMALMLTDALVVFDNLRHTVTILANLYAADGDPAAAYAQACATIEEVRAKLDGPLPRVEPHPPRAAVEFPSNMTRERFEEIVERIVPSPYMYFLDFGDFQVAGASPEPLITVTGREVRTRPIAGTRPRGSDAAEDERLERDLLADEKERAEHMMLVDLGRNDLGRVCEYGSVTVETLMAVEHYSHVMHIVSAVSGHLREGVGAMDALRATLPAGTLSGAPKVRAMQIIDELEPVKRGGYGGAIGYLSYTGELDTAIHIRTVVVKDGVAHLQAGGGTVADAQPANEYRESVSKAQAVLRAIELAGRQVGWE
jgi:anthranilate synthase component 1